jgi:predicted AlkP superfamily phosphohydrolase/phosphomutase
MAQQISVLVIGLDGATFDLITPWEKEGYLPNISRLRATGTSAELLSTIPDSTFPAWSSFMTGLNPGKHGVFGFTQRIPGTYHIKFINARSRHGESLFRLLSKTGRRVGVMGVPATYPPEEVNGFLIAGFDSPVTTGIEPDFVYPRSLYQEIAENVGHYHITDFSETNITPGWHESALTRLERTLERKLEIAKYLYRKERWDFFMVLFGESDTVAHHFWMFHDEASPRFDSGVSSRLKHAIRSIYEKLDAAIGSLLELCDDHTIVMIVSDHGFGGTGDKVLYLNRWLAESGLLTFKRQRLGRLLYHGRMQALRILPSRVQEQFFRRFSGAGAGKLESAARLGFIDFAETDVFSEEFHYAPSFWLNLAGRDPSGRVAPGRPAHELKQRVKEQFMAVRNPDTSEPVVERVCEREELYHGPFVERAPDLIIEPGLDRGYSYAYLSSLSPGASGWIRALARSEFVGAKGASMNGSHRRNGIFLMSGEGVRSGKTLPPLSILDVAPTILSLYGIEVPDQMDGKVIEEASG